MRREDIEFILFNNRSINLTKNFIPKNVNPFLIAEIDNKIGLINKKIKSETISWIEKSKINSDVKDIDFNEEDIKLLSGKIIESHHKLLEGGPEKDWLEERGIDENIIKKWFLGSMSHITDQRQREILGITPHPIMNNIIQNIENDLGVIIPLFDHGLINVTNRKLNDQGRLKYCQAIPQMHVWGLPHKKTNELWICEGLFDMMAIRELGKKAVSVSSARWSSVQIAQILNIADEFNIWVDDDPAGLRSGWILQQILKSFNKKCQLWYSPESKDPSEHYFENHNDMSKLEDLDFTIDQIMKIPRTDLDIGKYFKERVF